MNERTREFLTQLADLLEEYDARFYVRGDEWVVASVDGDSVQLSEGVAHANGPNIRRLAEEG